MARLRLKEVRRVLQSVLAILVFTACGPEVNSPLKKPTGSSESADAWNAPTGNAVSGATLFDGWQDLREVAAPVTVNGGWTDSVTVMPDGKRLFFGYTRLDSGQFFDSSGAVQNPSGPSRTGMTGDAFKIFQADLTTSGWQVSFHPVNGNPAVHEAAASVNAAGDLMVFSRFDVNGVGTLYYSSLSGGVWSAASVLPTTPAVNTPNPACTNDNGFIVGTLSGGLTLYFESSRDDLAGTTCRADGKNRLYFTNYTTATGFTAPQLVPGLDGGLPNEDDTQISLTPDKQTVFFTRAHSTAYGVFTADWNGTTFTNVRQIISPNFVAPFTSKLAMVGEANLATTSSGKILYMMCGIASSEAGGHAPATKVCRMRKPN